MIDLIYDCDITMELPGRDVNDGLALLYLLGSPVIRPLGNTSTFGNSSIEEVHPCLLSFLDELGRLDIPAYRGASRKAVKAASLPCGAAEGRNGRTDSEAARCAATMISGNLCLRALLTRELFNKFIRECVSKNAKQIATYLKKKILPWVSWIQHVYDLPGFHGWDATAALYLTDPQLFEPQSVLLRSNLDDLRRGFLRVERATGVPAAATAASTDSNAGQRNGRWIDVPSGIRYLPEYWKALFDCWSAAGTA